MIRPIAIAMTAFRWAPFIESLSIQGLDLSGGAFRMQVRSYPDAPGAPLVDLANASPGTQGISVSVSTAGGVSTSTLVFQIDEITIENMLPFPDSGFEPGAAAVLVYDLHVAATGLPKTRLIEGKFIIEPGATQA